MVLYVLFFSVYKEHNVYKVVLTLLDYVMVEKTGVWDGLLEVVKVELILVVCHVILSLLFSQSVFPRGRHHRGRDHLMEDLKSIRKTMYSNQTSLYFSCSFYICINCVNLSVSLLYGLCLCLLTWQQKQLTQVPYKYFLNTTNKTEKVNLLYIHIYIYIR